MPKIAAATVAEHRARLHQALLTAARDILLGEGAHAVTPAAVGARAGLARSSVYKYFSSTADIYAQMIEEAFARWSARLRAACDAEPTPDGKVRAYVRTQLRLADEGEHRIASALSGVDFPPECAVRIGELHAALNAPLQEALGGDPIRTTLIRGVIDGGVRLIEAGQAHDQVATAVLEFIRL